jgi:hypothetical protein
MAALLGRRIQKEHPEVAEMYRNLTSLPGMVKALGLIKDGWVSEHIARNAVQYALHGYHWGFNVDAYEGLITDAAELDRIRLGYRKKVGNRLRRQKRGIHGMSDEQRSEAGRAGAAAMGWIVFTNKEREYAVRLCADPRFCYDRGRPKGKPKLAAIAEELNKRFHKGRAVRNRYSVNFLRCRAKKRSLPSRAWVTRRNHYVWQRTTNGPQAGDQVCPPAEEDGEEPAGEGSADTL